MFLSYSLPLLIHHKMGAERFPVFVWIPIWVRFNLRLVLYAQRHIKVQESVFSGAFFWIFRVRHFFPVK